MELVSRHYEMNKEQVFRFDWIFLKPLINELNQLKEEYYICHSHYFNNPTTPNEPYHITMRILASKNIIDGPVAKVKLGSYKMMRPAS